MKLKTLSKKEVLRSSTLAEGWLAGRGAPGLTAPILGPITSRLQDWRLLAVDCRTVDCRTV